MAARKGMKAVKWQERVKGQGTLFRKLHHPALQKIPRKRTLTPVEGDSAMSSTNSADRILPRGSAPITEKAK